MNAVKGFTLIELLIVIGILTVLATVTVLVLNPAQLFAETRDSQRLADLKTLQNAIDVYLLYGPDNAQGDLDGTSGFSCATSFGSSASTALTSDRMFTNTDLSIDPDKGILKVDGNGWVPIIFTNLTSVGVGSPISRLPRDPVNDRTYNYQYACEQFTSKKYELDAKLESNKYIPLETSDGGDNNNYYELGNFTGLNL